MQCVNIQVVNDSILELNETFAISLEVSSPGVVLENNTATVVIEDDDGKLAQFSYVCSVN